MRTGVLTAVILTAALAGCEAPLPSGSSTGYYRVGFDVASEGFDPADIVGIDVGGVRALDLRIDGDSVDVLVQGAPDPGEASVVVTHADGSMDLLDQRFEYLPPEDARFERVVAFGASLTQGVMDAVPTSEGTLDSPALALARVLGAYMPQPQLVPGLFRPLALADVGPPPACSAPNVVAHITDGIAETLPRLARPDDSGFGYEMGRLDPRLEVRNLSAGNYQLDDTVHGPDASEIVQIFLGHLAFDPFGTFGEPSAFTQLDAVEALNPTLVFTTDLMGNDALGSGGGRTPPEQIEADLSLLVPRLAATGAEVFIGDMPDVTILPNRIASPDPRVTADIELYNAALHRQAAPYPNVHVVPLFAETARLAEEGLEIGEEHLDIRMLGGLLSFDGLHFSATGYGLVAQVFADSIAEVLGVDLPPVDLPGILSRDRHAPRSVLEAGRDPALCVSGARR